MLFKFLPAFALLASTVSAQAATIIGSMAIVQNDAKALGTKVSNYKGGLFSALPIMMASMTLQNSLMEQTGVVSATQPLALADVAQLATPTQSLVTDVVGSLTALMDAKPKFQKFLLTPIISMSLATQKTASDGFQSAIIAKVPAEAQGAASQLTQPINDALTKVIATYSTL